MKLPPPARKASSTAKDASRSAVQPKTLPPTQISDTSRSVPGIARMAIKIINMVAQRSGSQPVTNGAPRSCTRYMEPTARDDRELLRAARRGDAECFGTFFRKHHAVVLGYLARRVADPEVAADLLAETFASLLTVVGDPRRGLPASPPGWLVVTARNLLIDNHRH